MFNKDDRVRYRETGDLATVIDDVDTSGPRGVDGYGLAVVFDDEPDTVVASGTDLFEAI